MNPLKIQDFIKVNVTLIKGSQPGGSVARTCLVSTFAASVAFPGRTKILSGTQAEIQQALIDLGFTTDDIAYKQATAFASVTIPVSEVMIGRRDAGDASWTATMTAIEAEDDSFALVVADTLVKTEQLQISAWCETRWKFYLTTTAEVGALTKTAGTLIDALFTLKPNKTAVVWYDPEEATNYGPAEIDSEGGTFSVLNGQTIILSTHTGDDDYDDLERTLAFAATAASETSSGFTTGLADGETILMEVDDADEITITLDDDVAYFPDGIANATVDQVVAFLTDYAPTVTWSVDTGEIVATSQRPGSSSKIEFTGGTAIATLGFSVGSTTGTGDFAFADAATATELATKINTYSAGTHQITVGTMAFNGTDDVGLTVDGLDVFVPSNTSNAQTLTDLKAEWDGTPAAVAIAAMTVNATTVTLTFVDYFEHTVVSYSPATADITGITNSTSATTPLSITASAVGTKLHIETDESGEEVWIDILGGTLLDELGIETGRYYGVGTDRNFIDAVWAGQVAYLASRLDEPGGSVPWDNMKLPIQGNALTATQRQNLRDQYANTYEERTANYPGELHWGVNCGGFNGDFAVWGLLWLPLRLSEEYKGFQDRMTARGIRVPYTDAGIAQVDAVLAKPFRVASAAGAITFDQTPFDPVVKVTGWTTPTIAQQSATNKANGKVSGWVIVQLDAGAIKAVELNVQLQSN